MENDFVCTSLDSIFVVDDSFKNDGGLTDNEEISVSNKKKVDAVSKTKRKSLLDLNKLLGEATGVEDSLEKEVHSDINGEEASSVGKEEFTENIVEQSSDPSPLASSANNNKLAIDLNEYP